MQVKGRTQMDSGPFHCYVISSSETGYSINLSGNFKVELFLLLFFITEKILNNGYQ